MLFSLGNASGFMEYNPSRCQVLQANANTLKHKLLRHLTWFMARHSSWLSPPSAVLSLTPNLISITTSVLLLRKRKALHSSFPECNLWSCSHSFRDSSHSTYETYIRPMVDYASTIWDPTHRNMSKLHWSIISSLPFLTWLPLYLRETYLTQPLWVCVSSCKKLHCQWKMKMESSSLLSGKHFTAFHQLSIWFLLLSEKGSLKFWAPMSVFRLAKLSACKRIVTWNCSVWKLLLNIIMWFVFIMPLYFVLTLLCHCICYIDVCCGRMYAIRRIKDGFRMHKTESDEATVERLIKQAEHSYKVMQRQVVYFQHGTMHATIYP